MIWHRVWSASIRSRLMFLMFSITAAAILIMYFYVVPQLESNLISQKIEALERDSAAYSPQLKDAAGRDVLGPELDAITRALGEQTGSRVTLLGIPEDRIESSAAGRLRPWGIADSQEVETDLNPSEELVLRAARSGRVETSSRAERGGQLAQVARPLLYQGAPRWVVVFSTPLDDVADNVSLIQRQILIAGAIALLVAMAGGYYAASFISRRIRRLERAAGDVAAGNFSKPIPVDSDDELGQLAQAFNEMQRKLARLDTARREFIANASHELRTPIFSLGGFVELLQDEDIDEHTRAEFLQTMREQVARLQKLTTDLLDLSRLDAGSLDVELESVPLLSLARTVADEFVGAASIKGSLVTVAGDPETSELEAICDPQRTAQIVRVLVDNALRHTPAGTRVTLETGGEGAGPAWLRVVDDGPGIGGGELPHLFDRFHSGDSGSGSGLGLAIARELAQRMEGRLEVASASGRTAFTLTLPLAGPRPHRRPASEPLARARTGAEG